MQIVILLGVYSYIVQSLTRDPLIRSFKSTQSAVGSVVNIRSTFDIFLPVIPADNWPSKRYFCLFSKNIML
jgi:hypothetical protein